MQNEQTPAAGPSAHQLESIAHNLCSLHDFPVDFVMGQERFARAVITEYLRSLPSSPASSSSVVQGDASGVERPIGLAANEVGAWIAKRDAEFEARLADLTITPDVSSPDEFGRSIFGALTDCPAMSIDKQADFVARALWPAVEALRPQPSGETRGPGGYLVKDFADGWYWTPNAALECTDGALVWSVEHSRYETAPVASSDQPEQGALEVVAWRYRQGFGTWFFTGEAARAERLEAKRYFVEPLTPAEPAEARVRELEAHFKAASDNACEYFVRATAAEAKLAKAKEALEPFARAAEQVPAGWRNDAKIAGQPLAGIGTIATAGDFRRAAEALAALQQAGEVG